MAGPCGTRFDLRAELNSDHWEDQRGCRGTRRGKVWSKKHLLLKRRKSKSQKNSELSQVPAHSPSEIFQFIFKLSLRWLLTTEAGLGSGVDNRMKPHGSSVYHITKPQYPTSKVFLMFASHANYYCSKLSQNWSSTCSMMNTAAPLNPKLQTGHEGSLSAGWGGLRSSGSR